MQANDQYLTFFLVGEEYAISILQVTDIIECGVVTREMEHRKNILSSVLFSFCP